MFPSRELSFPPQTGAGPGRAALGRRGTRMATRGWTASPPRRGATKGLRKEARLGTLGDRKKAQQNLGLGKLFLPHHLGETQDCMPSPSL